MKNSKTINYSINIIIIGLSVVFWILLLFDPVNVMAEQHCHVAVDATTPTTFDQLLTANPMSGLMLGWILMVFAMMLPKLISPIQHIYERSFKRKRFPSAVLFILGYALVWSVMGVFMNAIILGFNILLPNSFIPAIIIGSIALVWQFSPLKQRFLNRGHDHRSLAAFGWAAYRDALSFGIMHGVWCLCSGWAIMLFPMLLPQGHNLAMFIVTIIMISEHMEHPQIPRWQFDLRLKLLKILRAQAKIKFQQYLTPKN